MAFTEGHVGNTDDDKSIGEDDDQYRRRIQDQIDKEYQDRLGRPMDDNEKRTEYENYMKYGMESIHNNLNERATNPDGSDDPNYGVGGGWGNPGGPGAMNSWLGQSNPMSQYYSTLTQQMQQAIESQKAREAQIASEQAERKARADELFGTLKTRSQQALNIDPNDTVVGGQVDAFRAEQERARRNLMSDAAEAGRPLSDVQQAMSQERVGQAAGSLRAELVARELSNRRNEIASALASMGGMLSGDQSALLQHELSNIDNMIQQQQLGIGNRDLDLRRELGLGDLGLGWGRLGLDTELGRGRLQNDLLGLTLQNNQFYSDLGLRGDTQDDYYNLVMRGRLGN